MARDDATRETRPTGGQMVEVVGPDGMLHHVGPFRQRAQAERWIAANTRRRPRKHMPDDTARPKLSVV